jgi:hypothetical protein
MQLPAQLLLVGEHPNRQDPEFYSLPRVSRQFQGHMGMTNFVLAGAHIKCMKVTVTGAPTNLWNVNNTTVSTDANPGQAPAALMTRLGEEQARIN